MTATTVDYMVRRFRSADGRLDLFARDYPAQLGSAQLGPAQLGPAQLGPAQLGDAEVARGGVPLLLMHGLTRNSADFEPLVPHLGGWRLIVPDQRGRGQSDYDDVPANYRLDVYVADMFALMGGLGIERFAIVGTSMGGLMGMIMAAMAPERIVALALNDVGPVVDDAGMDRIRSYVGPGVPARDWAEAAARIAKVNAVAFPDFGDDDWMAFARRTCVERADGVASAYDPAIAEGIVPGTGAVVPADLWPIWDAFAATPVLVMRGALSDLLSSATVEEMARRHSGPFAAVDIPLRGHAPLIDEPVALAALLPFLHSYAR